MAWGFVHSDETHQGAGSSIGLLLTQNPAAGNRLIVVTYCYGAGVTVTQVADSKGNGGAVAGKFDLVTSHADAFNGHMYLHTVPVTAGGSDTVTATFSGSASFGSIWVGEYSGLSADTGVGSTVIDSSAGNGDTLASTSPASGTTATISTANELAVAALGTTAAGACSISGPAGWTSRFNDTPQGTWLPLAVNDRTPATGAGASATWTNSTSDSSNGYAAVIGVFRLPSVFQPTMRQRAIMQAVKRASGW